MRLSLNSHPEKYEFLVPMAKKGFQALGKLSLPARFAAAFCALYFLPALLPLFGGLEFARRHVYIADLSHSKSEKVWHWCVAGIEAIPVLGTLIALVESVVYGLGVPFEYREYRPLWCISTDAFCIGLPGWSVPHWSLITSIKKDTTLADLKGSEFDQTGGRDMAILCAAAYVGNIDLIRDLIPTMSEFTSTAYHSPLIYAIEGRQSEALKALLEELPDVQEHLTRRTLVAGPQNVQPYTAVTPLWLAAQKLQDVSLVKPLLQARIPIQGIGVQGKAVIKRATDELAEESRLLQKYIEDKNVCLIIAAY